MFWSALKPFAWLLFFPAVFFSAWISGLAGGVIATVISTALAWSAFIPPEGSFALENPLGLASIALFMGMGFLFSYTQERVKKANQKTAEALAVAVERTAQLEAANKELESFSYAVSHDLRAPLRHIDGFSQLLVEEHSAAVPEEVQRYLNRIREGTRQMSQLVDDLLNFSRLGRQELNLQLTGLNSLVEEVVAGLQPESAGRTIEWKIDPLPFLECDPALMKRVLSNLLSNAVKFTRPRERAIIEVGSLTQDARPAIFVRDNGVGFSMKYADKLFGIFQRLHRQEDFEGTGVGLATVQRIIHKHGGRVWAEAEVNRGATFYFTLPEAPVQSQPTPEVSDARTGR
jgi:light-regulated signal transduction histidine kinase (bacteriophytochrome)